MRKRHRIVVALGGNAITRPGTEGTVTQQFERTRESAVHLADLIDAGHQLLITHGNGPQVGALLRRVELSSQQVYPVDLGLCVAESQGEMGYMICQCLVNELHKRGRTADNATTIVTTVLVDRDDPAFAKPTKPIGPFLSNQEAHWHEINDGWQLTEVPNRGMRRVVPSPQPKDILELPLIRRLVDDGELLVACGGGGIPVVQRPGWGYEGVEAVVDKDLSAALLAAGIAADVLAILTDEPEVFVDYGKPTQRPLTHISADEARSHCDAGQFPAGSMGPKVRAAINFVNASPPGAQAVITSPEHVVAALQGQRGTWIDLEGPSELATARPA